MNSELILQPTGFEGEIKELKGDEFLQSRLVDLGIVRGEKIKISQKSLFGDLIVEVRGTHVALRAHEARCLLV